MDGAKRFFAEILVFLLHNTQGEFSFEKDSKRKKQKLSNLNTAYLKKVAWLKIQQLEKFNVIVLKEFSNVQLLILTDGYRFKLLYHLYVLYLLYLRDRRELQARIDRLERLGLLGLLQLKEILTKANLVALRDHLESLDLSDLEYLRNQLDILGLLSAKDLQGLSNLLTRLGQPEKLNLRSIQNELEQLDSQVIYHLIGRAPIKDQQGQSNIQNQQDVRNLIDRLKQIEPYAVEEFTTLDNYVKEVKKLQSLLPNCKIYY